MSFNIIGTLKTPFAGMSLRLPPPNSTRSTSETFSGKASLHAVLDAKPVTERRAGRAETLYEVLRVERNATPAEIKTAYRSLAKVYHPDLKRQGDFDFIEIHNAYATLSDPVARATYDRKSSTGLRRTSGLHTTVGNRQGFYTCRRWETDQCW